MTITGRIITGVGYHGRPMALADSVSFELIKTGDKRLDFRGTEVTVIGGRPPQHEASSGHIQIQYGTEDPHGREAYPSVVDAKWILAEDL
jgi:hypothetical protein